MKTNPTHLLRHARISVRTAFHRFRLRLQVDADTRRWRRDTLRQLGRRRRE